MAHAMFGSCRCRAEFSGEQTFTCLTWGTAMMHSPTSRSPMDLDKHRPPGQHLRGPTWNVKRRNLFTPMYYIYNITKQNKETKLYQEGNKMD